MTKYILKNENIKSFYKGYLATFYCTFLPSFILYSFYEGLNKFITDKINNSKHAQYQKFKLLLPLVSAGIAEIASMVVLIPFDTVRTRM